MSVIAVCLLIVLGFMTGGSLAGIGGRLQTYKVKGQVFCAQDPSKAVGISVRLMEEDDFAPDDEMDEGVTDEEGKFFLEGKEREFTPIDSELKIFHDCNDRDATGAIKNVPCKRKWKMTLPDLYINGVNETEVMDIGRINLEIMLPGEERDCVH